MNGSFHLGLEHHDQPAIAEYQLQKLKTTLVQAYSQNTHYRRKFDDAGFKPDQFSRLKDLVKVPFLTKEDLRQNYPFGLLARPLNEISRIHSSSGTTGKTTIHGYTQGDVEAWSQIVARALYYAGVRPGDLVQITHGYGLFTGGLGVHYGAEKLGCAVVPTSTGRTAMQVQLLKDLQTTVLVGTPSYILTITDEIERQKLDVKTDLKLRICICGAEPWSENLRKDIEKRLGVRAFDLYGLSEVIGPGVASEHFDYPGQMVVWEDHFYPEIVSPTTGQPMALGDEGELVITTLTQEGSPVIRYRTGDLSSLSPSPKLSFRGLTRIKARLDDMIKFKGVSLYPSQIENILFLDSRFSGHFQIELFTRDRLDQIRIRLELGPGDDAGAEKKIATLLQSMTGVRMDVVICKPGQLPRSTGKAARVQDDRLKV